MLLFKENLKIIIRITHFLLLPLVLLLLFPDVALSKKVYVNERATNIRSGPGLGNSVIAVVKLDETLTILKEEKEWLNVVIPSGKEGWISRKMVKAEKPNSIIIEEYKDTINHQKSEIEELKKNVAATIKKKEKLNSELEELKLSKDQLIVDTEKRQKSSERFLISGSIVAGLIILILGFLAGQIRLFRESKRFDKMAEVAKVPKYQEKV